MQKPKQISTQKEYIYKTILRKHIDKRQKSKAKEIASHEMTVPFQTREDIDIIEHIRDIQNRSAINVYQKLARSQKSPIPKNKWLPFTFEVPVKNLSRTISMERRSVGSKSSPIKNQSLYKNISKSNASNSTTFGLTSRTIHIKTGTISSKNNESPNKEYTPKSHTDLSNVIQKAYSECKEKRKLSRSPPKNRQKTDTDKKPRRSRAERTGCKTTLGNSVPIDSISLTLQSVNRESINEKKVLKRPYFNENEKKLIQNISEIRKLEQKVFLLRKITEKGM